MFNWFSQVASVVKFGLLSIPQRRGSVAAALFGIVGVVGVLDGQFPAAVLHIDTVGVEQPTQAVESESRRINHGTQQIERGGARILPFAFDEHEEDVSA